MRTIDEIRLGWLGQLILRYGSLADLNEAIGKARTDATLSQIKNAAPDSKTGKARGMGDKLARDIESKLNLERGLLDSDPDLIRYAKAIDRQMIDDWACISEQEREFFSNAIKDAAARARTREREKQPSPTQRTGTR